MPGSTFVGGSIDIHVRFEALGGNARRAQIFRRHEDLQREYEHQVKGFARETRHVTSKLSRIQSEHLSRMKAIQRLEPQTFPEEWPPLEERRIIAAQMEEGLPLLTGATPPKQGSSLKKKGNSSTRNSLQKTRSQISSSNANSSSPKLNGMLSRPHFASPKTQSFTSQSSKSEISVAHNHSSGNNAPHGHPRSQQQTMQESPPGPPVIFLPEAQDHDRVLELSSAPTSQAGVSPRPGQLVPPLHGQPGAPSPHPGLNTRGDTSVSSNRGPRRRGRARRDWTKQENVLLFKIEAREGKETYTQVAQRKYPSYI
ncbi:hypothetical protein EGW08_019995 [Elysia chlorotica]|uniref:Uncharacterized protein n=1 Tax=Elysia chlorotica TaxID=188477 RepID=A0A3S1BQA4_ELYCH|nr:hypothetical protein EGW08_019995 [Elysia chlorotica]